MLASAACGVNNGSAVSNSDFQKRGHTWPLSVERGRVGCDGPAYWFASGDGKKYGLNGIASAEKGYEPIEEIWAVDTERMAELRKAGIKDGIVLRVDIGGLIAEAEAACAS